MLGKINILVQGKIEEDADSYMGAVIDDYDEEAGVLHLFVDPDDISASWITCTESLETEAWGVSQIDNLISVDVVECSWNGHEIINGEQVCWLFVEGGHETWH